MPPRCSGAARSVPVYIEVSAPPGTRMTTYGSSPGPGVVLTGPGLPSRQGQGIFTMSCPAYLPPSRLPPAPVEAATSSCRCA
jgi:hypothetical protein